MSEYITIVKCTDKLENALQYDRDIAHFLFENGFICKDVYEDVLNPKSMLSVGDKAGLLVSGIRKKVELNPQNYMKLIKHLRRDEKYSDILFIMESVYSDTQQSASSYAEPTSISIEKKVPKCFHCDISVALYKWKKIGTLLDIPSETLDTWEKEDDPLFHVISHWLSAVSEPSRKYSVLAEVFKHPSVRETVVAERICTKYGVEQRGQIGDETSGDSEATGGTSDGAMRLEDNDRRGEGVPYNRSISITSSLTDSSISDGLSKVNLKAFFPYLSNDMTKEDRDYYMHKLDEQTSRIKRKFASFVFQVQTYIENYNISTSKFVSVFIAYDAMFKNILSDSSDITEVFIALSDYWSFFDYELIKLIVETFRNDSILKKFVQYKLHLQEFFKRRICECPRDTFGIKSKGEKLFAIKIERSLEEKVEELAKIRVKINRVLGSKLLRLLSVDKGCIQLTYRMLPLAENKMFIIKLEQQEVLRDFGVLSLTYGDVMFELAPLVSNSSLQKETTTKDEVICDEPGEGQLVVDGQEAVLPGKPGSDYNDADSGFGSVGASTNRSLSLDDCITSAEETHEFQEYVMRDLEDPRLEMLLSAEVAVEYSLVIHNAVKLGDLDEVKSLVAQGHNPMLKDTYDNTALHVAAQYGKLNVLKYLIEDQGCNPASHGRHEMTPLHTAAERKHLAIVDYLISKHQVDPLSQDGSGYSPLHRACQGGDLSIVKYLMDAIMTFMKIEDIFTDFTKYKTSPVHVAAMRGHVDILNYFITDMKSDPNLPSGVDGRGPIFFAAQQGHLSVIKFLIFKHGCDPEITDIDLSTPLHFAAQYGHLLVVRFLIRYLKCNPLCRNSSGNTPLHLAAHNGHIDVVKFFIADLECDHNIQGQFGRTPLHEASQMGHLNLVKCLIEKHYCDPTSKDDNGATSLHIAARKGQLSVLQYFIDTLKCSPMCYDLAGNTPLHVAAMYGHIEIVKYLGSMEKQDGNSLSVLERALERALGNDQAEVVQYLLSILS